ncbi:MAG: hypothetical protein AB7S38_06240 [Vulcanimicrobiota bacterium]
MRLEALLEELSRVGRLDSHGRFSLSPALAGAKSRRYQLTDPHGWVLEVAAFALLWGCPKLSLASTSEGYRLDLGGPPLSDQDLDRVCLKLRLGELAGRRGALGHLAVGLNSALGLARRVEVISGSRRLLLYPNGRQRNYSLEPGQPNALVLVARKFWRMGRGADRECSLLERRCSLHPLSIQLDSGSLPVPTLEGWLFVGQEPVPSLPRAEVLEHCGPASVWMCARPGPARLHPVVAGVEFPTKEVLAWPDLEVVAWDRRLVTNVSHSEVVEDGHYQDVLAAVEELLPALAEAMARQFERSPGDEMASWLANWLRTRPGPSVEAPLLALRLLRRSDGRMVSLTELGDYESVHGQVLVCDRTSAVPPLDDDPVVLADELSRLLLPAFFPFRVDGEAVLLEAERAARNRTRWASSPVLSPQLESELVTRLRLETFVGEIGLRAQGRSKGFTLLKSGRWLTEFEGELPDGVEVIADHPDFQPNRGWDGVEPDQLLARLFQAVHEALPYLFEQCPRPELVPAYDRYRERHRPGLADTRHLALQAFAEGCQACAWWQSGVLGYGPPIEPAGAYRYRGPGVPPEPLPGRLPDGFGALLLGSLEESPDPDLLVTLVLALEQPAPAALSYLAELHRRGRRDCCPALAQAVMFEARPNPVSLAAVLSEPERHGWLSYAYPDEFVSDPPEPHLVVILHPREARVLTDFLGSRQVRHDPDLGRRLAGEERFLARPAYELPEAPDAIRARCRVLAGEFWLDPHSRHRFEVILLHRGRLLYQWTQEVAIPGLRLVLERAEATPNRHWDGILFDPVFDQLKAEIEAEVIGLASSLAQATHRPRAWRHLWLYLTHYRSHTQLTTIPLFPTTHQGLVSYQQLDDHLRRQGWLGYLTETLAFEPQPDELVLAIDRGQLTDLIDLFGADNLFDQRTYLRARCLSPQPRLETPGLVELPLRLNLPGGTASGRVVLHRRVEGPSLLHLERHQVTFRPQPYRLSYPCTAEVRYDALTPNPDWSRAIHDQAFQQLVGGLNRLLEQWLAGQHLRAAGEPEWRQRLLDLARYHHGHAEVTPIRTWLAGLPLFADLQGQSRCLAELGTGSAPQAYVVNPFQITPELLGRLPETPVVVLEKDEVATFRALVRPSHDWTRRLQQAEQFWRRQPATPRPDPPADQPRVGWSQGWLCLLPERTPSQIELAWWGAPVEQLEVNHPLPFRAYLDCPEFVPTSRRGGLTLEARTRILADLKDRLVGLIKELAASDEPPRAVLLRVLEATGRTREPALTDLHDHLRRLKLLSTLGGPAISYQRALEARERAGRTLYLPERTYDYCDEVKARAAARYRRRDGVVLFLSETFPAGLRLWLEPLESLEKDFCSDCQALTNQSRRAYSSTRLEEHYPDRNWLVQQPVEGEFAGWAGFHSQPGSGRLRLTIDLVALVEVHSPLDGLFAVLDGPFEPNRTWDNLADPRLLSALVERMAIQLLRQLATDLALSPAPEPLRQTIGQLFDWPSVWRTPEYRQPPVLASLARLKLFPLAGGRRVGLAFLKRMAERRGSLAYLPPGQAHAASASLLSLAHDDPWLDWLAHIAGHRPQPVEQPEKNRPEPLLAAVQEQFELLAADHPSLLRELEKLSFGPTPPSTFCDAFPGGVRPVLAADHPFVARLRHQESLSIGHVYMLCSALFSVMNRSSERLTDLHERSFHKRLLDSLC